MRKPTLLGAVGISSGATPTVSVRRGVEAIAKAEENRTSTLCTGARGAAISGAQQP